MDQPHHHDLQRGRVVDHVQHEQGALITPPPSKPAGPPAVSSSQQCPSRQPVRLQAEVLGVAAVVARQLTTMSLKAACPPPSGGPNQLLHLLILLLDNCWRRLYRCLLSRWTSDWLDHRQDVVRPGQSRDKMPTGHRALRARAHSSGCQQNRQGERQVEEPSRVGEHPHVEQVITGHLLTSPAVCNGCEDDAVHKSMEWGAELALLGPPRLKSIVGHSCRNSRVRLPIWLILCNPALSPEPKSNKMKPGLLRGWLLSAGGKELKHELLVGDVVLLSHEPVPALACESECTL
ncbi:hypothetical protein L1887_01199 [Cichorium endivia]|nr:hypothetical protein L1887_01199 [Cichorium endivia]